MDTNNNNNTTNNNNDNGHKQQQQQQHYQQQCNLKKHHSRYVGVWMVDQEGVFERTISRLFFGLSWQHWVAGIRHQRFQSLCQRLTDRQRGQGLAATATATGTLIIGGCGFPTEGTSYTGADYAHILDLFFKIACRVQLASTISVMTMEMWVRMCVIDWLGEGVKGGG